MTLTVPCLFGLESLVADEMRRLDLKNVRAENGRVHCEGTLADIARLNINLRWSLATSQPVILRRCFRGSTPCPGRTISHGTANSL